MSTTAESAVDSKARTHDRNEARQVSRPVATPQTSIVEVTPTMAAFFVEKNAKNRSVRPQLVNAYARVIEAGGWELTGEALKFDTEGNLIDGQHRCLAIIKANTPVMMTIIRGLTPKSQAVMDSGAKRTTQDYFLMAGVKNSAVVSSIARLSVRIAGYRGATNAELIAWVEDHPDAHAAAEISVLYRNSIDVHPSVIGTAWMALSKLDLAKAEEFFDSIANHRTEGTGDPRAALIRRMTSSRRTNERLSQEAQLSLVYRSWNAWVSGEQLFRIPVESRSGSVKIPEPLKDGERLTRSGKKIAAGAPKPQVDVSPEDYDEFEWPESPVAPKDTAAEGN